MNLTHTNDATMYAEWTALDTLIYEQALSVLIDDSAPSYQPSPAEEKYAEAQARRIRDGVMNQLDGLTRAEFAQEFVDALLSEDVLSCVALEIHALDESLLMAVLDGKPASERELARNIVECALHHVETTGSERNA